MIRAAIFLLLWLMTFPGMAIAAAPNVLLIVTDDQGYGDFSLHGNPYLKTPHIDRLGQESIRFERFFVNSFCSPARAALLTGRYPLRCGVWGVTHNKECMRADEVTLAEVFRGAGYRTSCIGKWHNGEQFPYTPPGQGFDEFFGFHNGHINNYFNTTLLRGATPEETNGYITDVLTDDAIRFITAERDRPFFCWLAYNAPHSPYQVPDQWYDRFRAQGLNETVSAFYGMCENIDANVGRLLKTLDDLGLRQDTIVLFLTDNGGTAGVPLFNAGMRGGKTSVHEGGCRVPLFVRWPSRYSKPGVIEQIVSHIDLFPTLVELCQIESPEGHPRDGLSLVPLLDGRDDGWPDRILMTHNPITETNRYPGAVRTQRYRLVREDGRTGPTTEAGADASAHSPWQLYDMLDDPGETRDLAAALPDVVDRLSRAYEEAIEDQHRVPLQRLPLPVGYEEENPVRLYAPQAFYSPPLQFHSRPGFAHAWLTGWTGRDATIQFDVDVVRGGKYEVGLIYGCPPEDANSRVRIASGNSSTTVTIPPAEAPEIPLPHRNPTGKQHYVMRRWGEVDAGTLSLPQGRGQITLQAETIAGRSVMDFKELILRRIDSD